jgi:hypothetical protein
MGGISDYIFATHPPKVIRDDRRNRANHRSRRNPDWHPHLSARRLRPVPALFAASPYRFDNNSLAASPQFLWRETGPVEWYDAIEWIGGQPWSNKKVGGVGQS